MYQNYKEELMQLVRAFIQFNVIGSFRQMIEDEQVVVYFKDYPKFFSLMRPDIYECLFKHLNRELPNKPTIGNDCQVLFGIVQEFHVTIPISDMFQMFSEQLKLSEKKIKENEVKMRFTVAIYELQNLGFIAENKHTKASFEKLFFAKTFFQSYHR